MSGLLIQGLGAFLTELDKRQQQVITGIDNGVLATAVDIQNAAINSIKTQSAGEEVFKRGVRHIQSKKGDAPNTDTGRLVGSIAVSHVKGSKVAMVFSDLDYAAYLEFALDRPWLEPAVLEKGKFLKENIANAVKKAIK